MKIKRTQKGAVNEFLGFILFLALVLGLILPLIIELISYTGQTQELDRLVKLAARRSCSLSLHPLGSPAYDLKQGAASPSADVVKLWPLVNSVFKNEAAHPKTYFENGVSDPGVQGLDGKAIDFKMWDYANGEIKWEPTSIYTPTGRADAILVGTNSESALCPAGGGKGWNYCVAGGDVAALKALSETGQNPNDDLIQRMEKLQAGRGTQAKDKKNDFVGRLDRCVVCATKTRESIFQKAMPIFGPVLACQSANDTGKMFPCKMSSCASARFTQQSTKRGENVAYQKDFNLGNEYKAVEVSAKGKGTNDALFDKETPKLEDNFFDVMGGDATGSPAKSGHCGFKKGFCP
ncbi:MAG: hypothetical protein ACK481_02540 [Candidatus Melainabacteria bacterium]|jgi:hypothetical protein